MVVLEDSSAFSNQFASVGLLLFIFSAFTFFIFKAFSIDHYKAFIIYYYLYYYLSLGHLSFIFKAFFIYLQSFNLFMLTMLNVIFSSMKVHAVGKNHSAVNVQYI